MQIIRQKQWTPEELAKAGFRYHARKRQIVMARILQPHEAPKTIVTPWDTLVAPAGYVICYEPGDTVWPSLEDYHQWPVAPTIFRQTYARWGGRGWQPTPAEAHLVALGCKPFYKFAGVWAKMLTEPTTIQTLESPEPVVVPPGVWVSIGVEGEPYTMSDWNFTSRYKLSEPPPSVMKRVLKFFARR